MQKVSANLSKDAEETIKIVKERGVVLREAIEVGTLEEVIQNAEKVLDILCTSQLKAKAYYTVCINALFND